MFKQGILLIGQFHCGSKSARIIRRLKSIRVAVIGDLYKGDIEYAIRQLKKKLQMDGIKRELKRREYYEKPSEKKRRKQAEAKRKLRKFKHRKA